MQAFISIAVKIMSAVLFVFCGMNVASALMQERETPPFLNMDSRGIWTMAPVRVDPGKQTFERLPTPPDPFPLKFPRDPQRKALDNARFVYDGKTFKLSGITPLDRKAVCEDSEGRKTACGLAAFKKLDNALRGHALECRVEGDRADETLLRCRIGGQDLVTILQPASRDAKP